MSGAKAEGKKIRKKEKAVRKQVQAPTYLEGETAVAQQRVNPYAYYKSTQLVEPVDGIEELNIRKTFTPATNVKENFRLTEIAPEKVYNIGKQVKLQEKAILGHQIASWAIDNEKPGEQKKLADIDPDLYAKMNEGPKDMAAFCMYLDQLLRKGEITNEEERLFVTSLLDPLVEIPVYPLWDPDGNVIGGTQWKAIHDAAALRQTSQKFGMFTQQLIWGASETASLAGEKGNTAAQRALKAMILIHLLPELRHAKDGSPIKVTITPATLTSKTAMSAALNGKPKNESVGKFMATYLANGVLPTDMAQYLSDFPNKLFSSASQTPFSYGMSLYGQPQSTQNWFGGKVISIIYNSNI